MKLNLKMVQVIALVLVALLSIFVFGDVLSSPDTHADSIRVLDGQKQQAMALGIAVTAGSTALTLLPDDVGSPIADEMADLSGPLFMIVCVLYLEKFLLTTLGWVSCCWLIPIDCVLLITYIFRKNDTLLAWIKKIAILAVALLLVIPTGTKITSMINETFSEQLTSTFGAAVSMTDDSKSEEENTNAFVAFFESIKDSTTSVIETAKQIMNNLIDAIAVLFITSCAIPLLTLMMFAWIIKAVVNIDIPLGKVLHIIPAKKLTLNLKTKKVKNIE